MKKGTIGVKSCTNALMDLPHCDLTYQIIAGFHLSGEVSSSPARPSNSSNSLVASDLPPGYTTLVEETPSKYKVSVNFDR